MSDGTGRDEPDEPGAAAYDESEYLDESYSEPDEPDFGIEPNIPEPPSAEDVDSELHSKFWSLVLVFNVALFAISIGAMFAVFQNDYTLGGQLMLGGTIVFLYGVYRYRTVKENLESDQNE